MAFVRDVGEADAARVSVETAKGSAPVGPKIIKQDQISSASNSITQQLSQTQPCSQQVSAALKKVEKRKVPKAVVKMQSVGPVTLDSANKQRKQVEGGRSAAQQSQFDLAGDQGQSAAAKRARKLSTLQGSESKPMSTNLHSACSSGQARSLSRKDQANAGKTGGPRRTSSLNSQKPQRVSVKKMGSKGAIGPTERAKRAKSRHSEEGEEEGGRLSAAGDLLQQQELSQGVDQQSLPAIVSEKSAVVKEEGAAGEEKAECASRELDATQAAEIASEIQRTLTNNQIRVNKLFDSDERPFTLTGTQVKPVEPASALLPPNRPLVDSQLGSEAETKNKSHADKSEGGEAKKMPMLPPPNPLLPKSLKVLEKPPESSVKGIVFRKLKEFKTFPDQPNDALSEPVKPLKLSEQKQEVQSPSKAMGQVQISIEQSRLVRNIVYLRDPSLLDNLGKDIDNLTQKDVFQHENLIDVKQLVRERDISERMNDQLAEALSRAKRHQMNKQNSLTPDVAPKGTFDVNAGCYRLSGPEDRTLLFESRFESGNLFMATKVSEQEYDLLMQNDTNTQGHTQWFYFKVSNTRAGIPIKFNILNYNKPDSMFNYGMKVSVYSEKRAGESANPVGWHRACSDISYFKNQIRKDFYFTKYYYTLTFTYDFPHDADNVFFAYCYPYTYSDLQNDIMKIERDPKRRAYVTCMPLCKTLGGVNCDLLTITESDPAQQTQPQEPMKPGRPKKQGVVISSRVHPGETVGSWMMRGVLFFLTDPDNKEAQILRQNFIFKIIPMLNPDGVINGNYRCSLAGCDLNRRWKFPSKQIQPTIYHTKRLIKKIHLERTCVLYCDLHGHSRKPNIFMYGCENKAAPEETRVFPLLLSKISSLFDFASSRFGVQKSKEATARVSVYKELKTCPLVYTMESTFSGLDKGPYNGLHISTHMLESMGRDLCRALLIQQNLAVPQELEDMPLIKQKPGKSSKTFSAEPPTENESQIVNQKALAIKQTLIAELQANKELINGDSSSGSDSEPSEDNLDATSLVKNLPAVDKPLSQALKQEQAAKKEQAKQARTQGRTSSPMKSSEDKKERWRFSIGKVTGTFGTPVADEDRYVSSPTRKVRPMNAKLSEIKEVHVEDASLASSPLKVARDVHQRNPSQKRDKDKVRMVDAVTQTDRSDYYVFKARNLKHTIKNQIQQQATLQLSIANIQLSESATAGPRHGSYHPSANSNAQMYLQGPTVNDFNQMFSPAVSHVPHGMRQLVKTRHEQLSRQQVLTLGNNSDYQPSPQAHTAGQANRQFQLYVGETNPPGQAKKPNATALASNAANNKFQEYLQLTRERHPPPVSKKRRNASMKDYEKLSKKIPLVNEYIESMAAAAAVSDRSNQNSFLARYGSMPPQEKFKQMRDFQAQKRLSQGPQRPIMTSHYGRSNTQEVPQGSPSQAQTPFTSIGPDSEATTAQDIVKMKIGSTHKSVVLQQQDYPLNNFKKSKRFAVGTSTSSKPTRRQQQAQSDFQTQERDMGSQTGQEMLMVDSSAKKRGYNNYLEYQPPQIQTYSDKQRERKYPVMDQHTQPGGSGAGQVTEAMSPLVAFLETQIQYEHQSMLQQKQKQEKGTALDFEKTHNRHKSREQNFESYCPVLVGGGSPTKGASQIEGLSVNCFQTIEKKNSSQIIQLKPISNSGHRDSNLPKLRTDSRLSPRRQLKPGAATIGMNSNNLNLTCISSQSHYNQMNSSLTDKLDKSAVDFEADMEVAKYASAASSKGRRVIQTGTRDTVSKKRSSNFGYMDESDLACISLAKVSGSKFKQTGSIAPASTTSNKSLGKRGSWSRRAAPT